METLGYMGIACDCPLCCYQISGGDKCKWESMLDDAGLMPLLFEVEQMFSRADQHRDMARLMEEIKRIMVGLFARLSVKCLFEHFLYCMFPLRTKPHAEVNFISSSPPAGALIPGFSPSSTWLTGWSGQGSSCIAA